MPFSSRKRSRSPRSNSRDRKKRARTSRSRSKERDNSRRDKDNRSDRGDRDRRDRKERRDGRSDRRRHSRSRSKERKEHTDKKETNTNGTSSTTKPMEITPTENTNVDLSKIDPNSEEYVMAKMGIPIGFDSTKGKKVENNDTYGVTSYIRLASDRYYRQYMNRKGGFNRPLDPEPGRAYVKPDEELKKKKKKQQQLI